MPNKAKRLTAETLHGIWAAAPMFWDERDRLDEAAYAENTRRIIASGAHGLYTTGSTGEFYAIDEDEFRRMVDLQVDLCGGAGMPLQIGCCADATRKTLRLLEYVADKPAVGAAQVVIPYWMELSDRELIQFFKDIASACADLPIVHYNIPRAKRFLVGPDYLRILETALPNLIGVKFSFAGQYFGQLQEAIRLTPNISYFVGEPLLASGMQIGARGTYSSLVLTHPRFMLEFYAAAREGRWKDALRMQQAVNVFFDSLSEFLTSIDEGAIDPVGDKGLAIAAGSLVGHQRCRAPYIGWSDRGVAQVRDWLAKHDADFATPS